MVLDRQCWPWRAARLYRANNVLQYVGRFAPALPPELSELWLLQTFITNTANVWASPLCLGTMQPFRLHLTASGSPACAKDNQSCACLGHATCLARRGSAGSQGEAHRHRALARSLAGHAAVPRTGRATAGVSGWSGPGAGRRNRAGPDILDSGRRRRQMAWLALTRMPAPTQPRRFSPRDLCGSISYSSNHLQASCQVPATGAGGLVNNTKRDGAPP